MRELYVDDRPPSFPPLLRGEAVPGAVDPFAKAVAEGLKGADPGLLVYSQAQTHLRAAVLFQPEMALSRAMGALFAVALGFADALGALAPPELAVHFMWPDRFKVNGALCGRLRAAAATAAPDDTPAWLVVGFDVPMLPLLAQEPGQTPDQTTLHDEGCTEVGATPLLESFGRHMLMWLNRFETAGLGPLHKTWCQRCDTLGEQITTPQTGLFMGLDEDGNMLLRDSAGTRTLPLTDMLEMSK